jgi:hypothetical protein
MLNYITTTMQKSKKSFEHFKKLLLIWKMEIRWENGSGGSGGYERIFSCHSVGNLIPTE